MFVMPWLAQRTEPEMQNLMVKRKKENTNVTLKNLKVIFLEREKRGKRKEAKKRKAFDSNTIG